MATIMIVDDSVMIRNLVKKSLLAEGYEIVEASDGAEALEYARQKNTDMVLTDINMPNMNGISLVSKLRRLDAYKDTPILMLTTETSDYKKSKSKNMGADGWLQKPFDKERLVNAVKTMLARKAS